MVKNRWNDIIGEISPEENNDGLNENNSASIGAHQTRCPRAPRAART